VQGADRVTVRLYDNREFSAKTIGTDPATDVAVIKIEATGLPTVRLGDADSTKIGNWVLAIGNPLGENFTFTVTAGIVSAKSRLLAGLNQSPYSIQDFIQTDAAINPGNSGGPLVNVRGEVIGINAAIASETGVQCRYGFAIPINLARTVMTQLIATGHVERCHRRANSPDHARRRRECEAARHSGVWSSTISATIHRQRAPAFRRATSSSQWTASRSSRSRSSSSASASRNRAKPCK
jgi:S1-C subfamily serine protease